MSPAAGVMAGIDHSNHSIDGVCIHVCFGVFDRAACEFSLSCALETQFVLGQLTDIYF